MRDQIPTKSGNFENQNQNSPILEKFDNQGEFSEENLVADKSLDD